MRVEFEIPDFVPPERIIHIMAGSDSVMERIGYIKPHSREVMVKYSRCSKCGKCCESVSCPSLENGLCGRPERPFRCCIGELRNISECTSKYRVL
jgi:hypothetical protein